MGINKVQYGNTTLIDLTADTVTADKLMQGYTAHDRSGALITGTATGGSGDGYVWQDENGYVHLSDEAREDQPVTKALTVTPTTSTQVFSPNEKLTYFTAVSSAKSHNAGDGDSGTTNNGIITPLVFGDEYRFEGTIDITDSNGDVITSYSFNKTGILSNSYLTVFEGENDDYMRQYKVSWNGGTTKYLAVGFTLGKAGVYGYTSTINIYEPITYTGYNQVTVNGFAGYTDDTITKLLKRNITSFDFPSGFTGVVGTGAFMNCSVLTTVSMPNDITTFNSSCFQSCSNLNLSSLPSSLLRIYDNAFDGCASLTLSSLPSGVTTLSSYCFKGCSLLALSSLPSGITSIQTGTFQNCYSITISSLPDGLTAIQSNAFYCCESITSISCNGVITTLGSSSFTGTSSHPMKLTSASFPNMALTQNLMTAFGSTTASNACQLLEFADIGKTTGIGNNAFANCYALETLVLRKTSAVCTLQNTTAFTNTPMSGYGGKTGTVYVPSDLISSYQTATNWKTLYDGGTVTFEAIEGSDYEL